MIKNDLSYYFGKNYEKDPSELSSLNATQKNSLHTIIKKCEKYGVNNKYAISAILSIVSKESNFIPSVEGSYSKTSANRIRDIFGKNRTYKYTNQQIDTIKKNDKEFFDMVYGVSALNNGFQTYGNDQIGDGYRYRGRGFNQITFKNIYDSKGKNTGIDLKNNPELLENIEEASTIMVDYFIDGFKLLLNSKLKTQISNLFNFDIKNSPINTINSLPSIESSVDIFYLINSGIGNYKEIIKYKNRSFRDSSGYYHFPNDKLGGYTKAVNRAPYFYKILSKDNTSEPKEDIKKAENIQNEKNYDTESTNDNVYDIKKTNSDFNPVQLVQIHKPIIKPTSIKLDSTGLSKKSKREFLTGMGTAPVIYYNGIHIEYSDIQNFELYHEGILPAMKITFNDRNGIFKDTGFPTDDSIISIFIYSRSKKIRSINMDFKISNFKDLGVNQFIINGIVNIPKIFISDFKSYSKKTSFESLESISKDLGIGFCSNISNTSDKMTWINTGFPTYQFIDNIVKNSYLSDNSFLNCYIDYYYNLCYVDVEKELGRDNSMDKMIISSGMNEFTRDPENDEDISSLILSTDKSVKNTNAYISDYIVYNKSTQVSLNKAYITKTKFYDSNSKELLIFDVDSITSEGDKTIILKGKPGEEDFFSENISNIWVGKLDKFEDDGSGNSHSNFNYSLIQNEINIDELSKISIVITLPTPNYNLYIYQKVYLSLINQKPGINHTTMRYKRLTGNWLVTSINYIFEGSNIQKVTLIKRELELEENEKGQQKNNKSDNIKNEFNVNELSPNDYKSDSVSDSLISNNSISNNTNDELIKNDSGQYITIEQLSNISNIKKTKLKHIIDPLNNILKKYNINTKLRISHFLSQILHESGGFQYFSEFASGSSYEGREDLGNLRPGDGVKYKGRGAIQITGRYNYEALSKEFGYDFVNNPKKLSEMPWAIESSGWFWNKGNQTGKSLNYYADRDDIKSITRKINGGLNGFSDREKYYLMSINELNDNNTNLV